MAESEDFFAGTESVARWLRKGRAAYEAEIEVPLFDFFSFLTGARCSSHAEKINEGTGIFFISKIFGFIVIVFVVLLCLAVLSLSYIQQAYQRKKMIALPGVCTFVRHVSERSGRNHPRREAYIYGVRAVFFLKHGSGTLGVIKSPVSLQLQYNKLMDLCPLRKS